MTDLIELSGMNKLSSAKKESILAAARHALSGKGVKAAKETKKANDALRASYTVKGTQPSQSVKDSVKIDKKVISKERLKTHGSRAAVGAAAALSLAGIAKALKRGGKSAVMTTSKKKKLMSALKKHRKGIAIGGGAAAGTAGLAAMLKNK